MNYFSFYKEGKALYCLFLMALIFSFSSSSARNSNRSFSSFFQQNQVHGVITDGSSPLPGVTLAVKGRPNAAAITDYTGHYAISAGTTDTLVVSFIGFKTKLIPVSAQSKINIVLEFDTTTLKEVRVNAGYYTVKESDRTGSIARITSKDIDTQPVTNVLAAMQGRMAGVSITQSSGVPGGGFDIKIRGQNSLRADANSPLYIIDGVPYSSEPIGSTLTSTIFQSSTSPLNSINPDTIESIEVLKDADATSIYGSRGANGVVLITTKKGKAGKTSFSFTSSTGAGTVTRFLKLMNTKQYLDMRRQAFINDGIPFGEADYDINGTWDQNRDTDWQKELLGGTAHIYDFQGSISGGSENTQFIFNGSYNSQSTVFPGDFKYSRGGGQLNINHRSEDKKFKITLSANYTVQDNNQPSKDYSSFSRFLPPNAPALYNTDGSLNWENATWQNPLSNNNSLFNSKTKDFLASTLLSYELANNLFVKSSFGYSTLTTLETRTMPSTLYNPIYNVSSMRSSLYTNNTERSSWIIEPQINWKKNISNGVLDILAGATFQQQSGSNLYIYAGGFSSNSLIYNLAAANYVAVLGNDESDYKYQAFFGRINYNLNQRYIVNLTARRDGSSRFGPGNRFAVFGAVGAAWIFSKENFLKNSSWLSFGKLRSSYGSTGNDQIGDYQYLNTYSSSGVAYDGVIGLQPSRLFNPDFGWEINKKLEMAVELGFLKDCISLSAAYYQNRSSNQLVGIPLPGTTGFPTLQANLAATVENRGLEFTLRTVNYNKEHFKWTTSFNVTASRNELLRFPGLESSSYSQKYRIGSPLNIYLMYKLKGVNQQTGIYEYEDLNKDGKITYPEDRQYAADLNPKYFGGFQNQFEYKNWKLDFLFQFVKQQNQIYPMGAPGNMANQQQRITNSWKNPGDIAPYQIFTTGQNSAAAAGQYYFYDSNATLTDASFIRLKNIAVSYKLPLKLQQSSCTVMLQAQNLLTFTNYKDGDPEFITYGFLPPLKIISASVQLTF
ncbi:SusC/RagA family TonB-linked outer membrane protein [Flavobacterium endoglycinae]|uniref:SusC/RagA family TonB-linked outer membrane protein n=2 Tax=Flavobacterium endoglycinae TaxID=2816357 RepID=A0ABX7QEW4_9FLAO|nr:SusC/RagA family TonB-linked outer membrane protein [Flavobacterium endoglycinae]